MKAKVIIENGKTEIILTPENDFEIDVIEKADALFNKHEIRTWIDDQSKIILQIKEISKPIQKQQHNESQYDWA